jgi:hypothetical protein
MALRVLRVLVNLRRARRMDIKVHACDLVCTLMMHACNLECTLRIKAPILVCLSSSHSRRLDLRQLKTSLSSSLS